MPLPARAPRFPPPPPPEDPEGLSRRVLAEVSAEGFAAAGIVAGETATTWDVYRSWLEAGHHGEMEWLERDAEARRRFDSILPYTRAVIAVAWEVPGRGAGNVARYARGEDYHVVVRRKLKDVIERIRPHCPPGSHFRVCVDTAPLLERELAVRAGLGSLGKNGLLIVRGVGSHVVLGEVLTDVALVSAAPTPDRPFDLCGSCTACLTACPTGAFVSAGVLDARRCLSYLTIEKRGELTKEQEAALDGRLFGCDDCQDACPWNHARERRQDASAPPASLDPAELVDLPEPEFSRRFDGSALWRATAAGLARNARAVLAAASSGAPVAS